MAQLAHHDPLGDAEVGHLLDYLATISDPRVLSGRRHPLVAILALAAAVLTGARSLVSASYAHLLRSPSIPAGGERLTWLRIDSKVEASSTGPSRRPAISM